MFCCNLTSGGHLCAVLQCSHPLAFLFLFQFSCLERAVGDRKVRGLYSNLVTSCMAPMWLNSKPCSGWALIDSQVSCQFCKLPLCMKSLIGLLWSTLCIPAMVLVHTLLEVKCFKTIV
ncbi:hypothetical protein SEVIR_9G485100v4 [Setaria viridis]|uniref:Secreted protein n=2 Tax=Setaria TaxID=4554 RepID=A0A368STN0_SETIT|nr:hypothetical protein SETIT_9G481400v2 [Setaria italica]TKV97301.1 hypothetical protein SEVIR_9G485100v2 [Setaria viridis]